MATVAPPASRQDLLGLYGKIPAQGDFVRVNASEPVVQALDQWLQENLDHLQRASLSLPPEPVFFAFRATGPDALVGAFVPSSDRVGRTYPLVAFARIPDLAAIGNYFSGIPVAYSPFLAGAAALLAEAPSADATALAARLRALRLPGTSDLTKADAVCRRTLGGSSGADLQRRLFDDLSLGRQYFAFKTFLDACDTVRAKAPARAAITLACPLATDIDLFAWLELARRRLQWTSTLPPYVWCEGSSPRLLIALGGAPATMLRFLVRPDDQAAQLWPLTTSRPDAVERAAQGLAPPYRQAIDAHDATLEQLLATLAR